METKSTYRSKEYIRVVVNSWDDEILYCTDHLQGEEVRVCYSGEVVNGHTVLHDAFADHSYLRSLLEEGAMLNVIRPTLVADGALLPELIILEPDFLVDVSTVVSCFESYAESPTLSLLKRLEPLESTEAILLGNMAGELLDEVVHDNCHEESVTAERLQDAYRLTAKKFFHRYAPSILSVNPGSEFHRKAWQQFMNIRAGILEDLPQQVEGYDGNRIIIEPTFFSEMLGLQGRMDMLQTDMLVLVEQKSGKGGFRPGCRDTDIPLYTEQHYMQMLLYMAIIQYNFRHVYEANRQRLNSFLLYSKYRRPLLGLGFARQLFFRAMKMRNLYAHQERRMSRGGIDAIMKASADDFNTKGTAGRLWESYQRPRLERILAPFRDATSLEQAYFCRFYRFIALEHRLSKSGNHTRENSGFAGAWLLTMEDKVQEGCILLGLEIVPPASPQPYVERLILRYDGNAGNFRRGDIVVLYPYARCQEPDIRCTMSFRAIITELGSSTVTLQLRNAQRNTAVFFSEQNDKADCSYQGEQLWCLEHDFIESSYSVLYKGLYAFLFAPEERRALLLMQRQPEVYQHVPLRGDYGPFNDLQQRIKNAGELFLVIGPPGTGKTSFGMLNTLQEELREEDSKVLIVSYTNRSVDEICSKLYPAIPFIRIGGEASASSVYHGNMLSTVIDGCTSVAALRDSIQNARVIVGTTAAMSANLPIMRMTSFSLCIVDEASQILEPHILPLLTLSNNGVACIRKFVMIGDHKQLSTVVQQEAKDSSVEDERLNAIGLTNCRNSLFERLLLQYRSNPELCYMLTKQGRMHRDIAHFPNVAFYGGMLTEVPLPHQVMEVANSRLRFIDVHPYPDSSLDKVNIAEAEVIVDELCAIWETTKESFNSEETVGVIVPYRNQISAIRTLLAERLADPSHPLLQITIDTVERYQGSQRQYIIYAFTVQRHYQLRFLTETTFIEDGMLIDRKLNVAMTRALEYLILIGNSRLVSQCPLYHSLLKYIKDGSMPASVS